MNKVENKGIIVVTIYTLILMGIGKLEGDIMLNKRQLRPVPSSTKLMTTFMYDATSDTDKEIFEPDYLNVCATILSVGDTLKLIKKDLEGKITIYQEYFILAVDAAELHVDFEIINQRVYDKDAFKFLKDKEKAKEAKENK